MSYEIDFFPVGEGEKSGDAIAFRYGNLEGRREEQMVIVIDGGTKSSGEAIVRHVNQYYQTDRIDFVLSTHPDLDHASGLTVVMENLDFGQLVMHRPWEHAQAICDYFRKPFSPSGLSEKLEKAISAAHDLERIALRRKKEIVEPFTGIATSDQAFVVLGPTQDYYRELLLDFRSTPETHVPTILSKALQASRGVATAVIEKIEMVAESIDIETLRDDGVTSAENNSSVISLLIVDGRKILFSADAGIPALTKAADYANGRGVSLADLHLVQVPHHGSRRNVSPSVLNRIKGSNAIVSVGKDCAPKHPAKKVTNAFIRRGASVVATRGEVTLYSDLSLRNWKAAAKIPFYNSVEDF